MASRSKNENTSPIVNYFLLSKKFLLLPTFIGYFFNFSFLCFPPFLIYCINAFNFLDGLLSSLSFSLLHASGFNSQMVFQKVKKLFLIVNFLRKIPSLHSSFSKNPKNDVILESSVFGFLIQFVVASKDVLIKIFRTIQEEKEERKKEKKKEEKDTEEKLKEYLKETDKVLENFYERSREYQIREQKLKFAELYLKSQAILQVRELMKQPLFRSESAHPYYDEQSISADRNLKRWNFFPEIQYYKKCYDELVLENSCDPLVEKVLSFDYTDQLIRSPFRIEIFYSDLYRARKKFYQSPPSIFDNMNFFINKGNVRTPIVQKWYSGSRLYSKRFEYYKDIFRNRIKRRLSFSAREDIRLKKKGSLSGLKTVFSGFLFKSINNIKLSPYFAYLKQEKINYAQENQRNTSLFYDIKIDKIEKRLFGPSYRSFHTEFLRFVDAENFERLQQNHDLYKLSTRDLIIKNSILKIQLMQNTDIRHGLEEEIFKRRMDISNYRFAELPLDDPFYKQLTYELRTLLLYKKHIKDVGKSYVEYQKQIFKQLNRRKKIKFMAEKAHYFSWFRRGGIRLTIKDKLKDKLTLLEKEEVERMRKEKRRKMGEKAIIKSSRR